MTQNESNQQASDDVWKQLDSEITGVPDTEGQLGDTHVENEPATETDSGRDDTSQGGEGTERAGPADTDAGDRPDDGTGRESGSEREDNAEIDYALEVEVPMPYGMEKMTVGAMKDAVSEMHLRQERMDKQSNEVMVERSELGNIVQQLEPYLTPEVLDTIKQRRQAVLARENQRMLEVIPEWEDNTVFQTDRKVMQSLAGEYGFSEREFKTVSDHRLVKLLRDYSNLRSRVEKARTEAKPISKGKQTKPGRQVAKSRDTAKLVENAKASSDPAVKDAAITQLIGES